MMEVLLSNPLVWAHLAYVAALCIASLPWRSDPPDRKRPARGAGPGRSTYRLRVPSAGDRNLPARRSCFETGSRELLSLRELEAACAAQYSARFSAASKAIRKA